MNILSAFQDKATKAKIKITKFLIVNKPFLNMVVYIMAVAYKNFEGKEKMAKAIDAIKLALSFTNLSFVTTYINSDELASELEKELQIAYDYMKAKGYIS